MRRPSPSRRHPRAGAPLRRPPAAARFGSIPTAACTTALVRGGTARPSKALTCPKPRRRRREPSLTTEKLALPKRGAAENLAHAHVAEGRGGLTPRLETGISARI